MSRPKQRSAPTFFIDRSLGDVQVAAALRAIGASVVTQAEVFKTLGILPANEIDEVWIAECGKHGWVALTKDSRIRVREIERNAVWAARIAMFALRDAELTGSQQCAALTKAYPLMVKRARDWIWPFMARVSATGAIEPISEVQRRAAVKRGR